MALSLRTRAHSEVGLVRSNNQDSAYVSPRMMMVADGMGGAAAGDLASAVAIGELQKTDEHLADVQGAGAESLTGEQVLELLSGALARANDHLSDLVAWDRALDGMGTTVCGAILVSDQYAICHIGDSRGYLVRDGELRRLTKDHSWVQSLVDDGKISPDDAASHPHRSLLLKVLNGQPAHTPEFALVDATLGDRLLFCSDGLCGLVEDDVLQRLLTAGDDLDAIVASLVEAAHQAGGQDNITLILADVVAHDDALEAVPPEVLGAARTVKIPRIDTPPAPSPGDGSRPGARGVPAEAAMVGRERLAGTKELAGGLIDPDRFEAIRYTPRMASRARRLLPLMTSLVVLLALVAASYFGGRAYLGSQYYIGPDDERVAIFQGLPDQILGRDLSTKLETSTVRVDDLPPYYAGRVRDADLRYDSVDQAHEQLASLGRMAERCIAERAASGGAPNSSSGPTTQSVAPTTDSGAPTTQRVAPTTTSLVPASATSSISPQMTSTTARPSSAASNRPDLEACG